MTAKDQAHHALLIATDRIGKNAFKAGLYKVRKDRKGKVIQGYSLTPEHQEVMTAIDALGRNLITPEDAMNVVSQYEVSRARLKGY